MDEIMKIVQSLTVKAPTIYEMVTSESGYTWDEWKSLAREQRQEVLRNLQVFSSAR